MVLSLSAKTAEPFRGYHCATHGQDRFAAGKNDLCYARAHVGGERERPPNEQGAMQQVWKIAKCSETGNARNNTSNKRRWRRRRRRREKRGAHARRVVHKVVQFYGKAESVMRDSTVFQKFTAICDLWIQISLFLIYFSQSFALQFWNISIFEKSSGKVSQKLNCT